VVELTEDDLQRPSEPVRTSSEFVTSASHRVSTDSVGGASLAQPKNSLTDDSTYGGSEAETTPVRRSRSSISGTDQGGEVQAPVPTAHSATDTTPPPALLRTGTETVLVAQSLYNTDSEAYRQRIESLRNDFGNGWLSALSDEPWEGPGPAGMAFSPPPAMQSRTPSQGIVSTGRTLG
jgi:hypothetical protein